MSLADRVAQGVTALREARWDDAIDALGPVADDAELAAADDLADVRARVLSLYAQALLEAGRAPEADAPCRAAIRVLRGLRDKDGLAEVRALQDRIVRALAHDQERARALDEMRKIATTPVAVLLEGADTPAEQAAVLVRKATACAETDRADEGAELARRAMELAVGHVEWSVLARVALARNHPGDAARALADAHAIAADADEFNLVSTVARAAASLGVELPREPGPHRPPGAA